jgi:hypothetical protein
MKVGRKPAVIIGGICLAIVAIAIAAVRSRLQDYAGDLESDFARNLTVDVNGSPFPRELRLGEPYPIKIRFQRAADAPAIDQYVIYTMVVGKRGYGDKMVDAREAKRQFPKRGKNAARKSDEPSPELIFNKNGRLIPVTPQPPADDDPALQYIALISPDGFKYNRTWGEPLELHVWAYPKVDFVPGKGEAGEPGHLIYRREFEVLAPK